jgi:hypothetical protein
MRFLPKVAALLCATAMPAMANPYRMISTDSLARAIEDTGTSIVYDSDIFYEDTHIHGYYLLEYDGDTIIKDELGMCVENHKVGDYRELGDTLRHEAIHVAQACNDHEAILPWNQLANYATRQQLSIVQRYPAEDQHRELEATVGARRLTNDQVATVLKRICQ